MLRLAAPSGGGASVHMLVADEQGFVVIDSRGIATVATQAALSTQNVVDAQVHVQGNGNSAVRLRANVGVHSGANIKQAGTETRERVRDAVEELVGIDVNDVRVNVHVLKPDDLARLLR